VKPLGFIPFGTKTVPNIFRSRWKSRAKRDLNEAQKHISPRAPQMKDIKTYDFWEVEKYCEKKTYSIWCPKPLTIDHVFKWNYIFKDMFRTREKFPIHVFFH
jgi:hypothetical protein